jgi:hypothetical protein
MTALSSLDALVAQMRVFQKRGLWKKLKQQMAEEREALERGEYTTQHAHRKIGMPVQTIPKAKRPVCGARTRAGGTCQARVVDGRLRCRLHGGASTGPRTQEGRQRIAESNRSRVRVNAG